ncbi:DYRK2 kinase, partial [Acromyrmex heyeri]
MTSLALSAAASRIEMPLSKTNPFVQAGAISTQPYISSSESSNHLPPIIKGTGSGGVSNNSIVSVKPKTATITPEMVMKLYMNKLTPYEHHEIFNYQQIYFIGANAKKRPGIIGRPNNNEYDNEQGSYIHVPHDHVAYRYEVLRVIGKGSFGQVVKAYDHKTHEHVALKMVRNEKRFHRQAHEEIRILRKLREQDKDNTMNIIHMFDSFTFRCHMCITFELLSINLYELIKKNNFKGFSLQLVRKFSHSLLLCLDALYKNKIIHCDMKPENVLLKQQGRSGIKAFLIMCRVLASHYQNWGPTVTPILGQIFYAKYNASKLTRSASDVGNIFYLMVSPAPQRLADRVSMLGTFKRLAK